MKKNKLIIIVMALVLVFALAGCSSGTSLEDGANAYFADYPGSRIVEWTDLFAMIDAGDEPFILSIRQDDVYSAGHIIGAYRASWGQELADMASMLPTDEKVYVYCYSGQTAGQTVALLNILGIDAVSVKSGYNNGASKVDGFEMYTETTANEMADAGAKFNKEALTFVEDYFASVSDNANFIRSAEAVNTLVEAGDVQVMDIRKADDYNMGHIEGAVNVPFGANMQERFSDFSMDKTIVVACYSGQTAGQTVGVLRALGYDAVSLKSGMSSWTPFVTAQAADNYFADYPGARITTWESIFEMMDAGDAPFILSIRAAADYDAGHITGAMNAAWGTDLADKISMLPTDQTVYVYCYSGQTAGQTIAVLNMMGVDAVSIKSGFSKGAMNIDGYEKYVDTTAVALTDAGATFNPFMLAASKAYFNAIPDSGSNIITLDAAQAEVVAASATVVDVRRADDFAAGHIQGAVNVPFGENMQESFGDLPEGKLIVACYSGQTAGQATAVLRMAGYDAVSLKYGMSVGWIAEGYPVVTD